MSEFLAEGGAQKKRLASGSEDKTAKLWDAESRKLLGSLSGHAGWVSSVAWSPDGNRLASGNWDKTVKHWDAESGKLLGSLSGHNGGVYSVAWSPDGKRLASGSEDKTVKLWDAESGKSLGSLSGHEGWVSSVAWSPDGNRLASAAGLSVFSGKVDSEFPNSAMQFINLPGTEWISFRPGSVWYCGSLQCDQFAGLRFNNQSRPIYPLYYYRDQLKRGDLLTTDPPPLVRLGRNPFSCGGIGSKTRVYAQAPCFVRCSAGSRFTSRLAEAATHLPLQVNSFKKRVRRGSNGLAATCSALSYLPQARTRENRK